MRFAYCATVQPEFGGLRTFNLGLSLALKSELEVNGHQLILITNEKYKSDYLHFEEDLILFSGNHFYFENVILPKKLAELEIDFAVFPHNRIPLFNSERYKKICIFHDLLFYRYPEKLPLLKRLSRFYNLRNAAKKTDFSFSVSEFTATELREFLPNHSSTVCLQAINPIDLSMVPDGPLPERFGISKPYFLYVGAKSFQKNLVALIKAFELFRSQGYDYQLVIAGGKGTAEAEVDTHAERSAWTDDILLPGFVSEEEKIQLLQHAKAFVFPSIYEGFGIPLLEAFQLRTVVICSNQACLPEIAGGAALEVNPEPEHIAAGMREIADNESLSSDLVEKGVLREGQFKWQRTASIILDNAKVPKRSVIKVEC